MELLFVIILTALFSAHSVFQLIPIKSKSSDFDKKK